MFAIVVVSVITYNGASTTSIVSKEEAPPLGAKTNGTVQKAPENSNGEIATPVLDPSQFFSSQQMQHLAEVNQRLLNKEWQVTDDNVVTDDNSSEPDETVENVESQFQAETNDTLALQYKNEFQQSIDDTNREDYEAGTVEWEEVNTFMEQFELPEKLLATLQIADEAVSQKAIDEVMTEQDKADIELYQAEYERILAGLTIEQRNQFQHMIAQKFFSQLNGKDGPGMPTNY